ncbi:MAG: hypothetical protein KAJ90_02820 [Desulfobacterales bacterium]|nr:hypothetical protein [Desulfobacterales bacterium]
MGKYREEIRDPEWTPGGIVRLLCNEFPHKGNIVAYMVRNRSCRQTGLSSPFLSIITDRLALRARPGMLVAV